LPKSHSNYTILTRTKEKLDVRTEQFGLKNSYPLFNPVANAIAEVVFETPPFKETTRYFFIITSKEIVLFIP